MQQASRPRYTIQQLRTIRRMSVADLARLGRFDPKLIERWEREEATPNDQQRQLLAGIFGVAAWDLPGGRPPAPAR